MRDGLVIRLHHVRHARNRVARAPQDVDERDDELVAHQRQEARDLQAVHPYCRPQNLSLRFMIFLYFSVCWASTDLARVHDVKHICEFLFSVLPTSMLFVFSVNVG